MTSSVFFKLPRVELVYLTSSTCSPFVTTIVFPPCRNSSAISVAPVSTPPPLLRTSRSNFFIPFPSKRAAAALNSTAVVLEKLLIRRYPISSLIMYQETTEAIGIPPRIIFLFIFFPFRTIFTLTGVFSMPFSIAITSSLLMSCEATFLPSTSNNLSPAFNPALSEGELGSTPVIQIVSRMIKNRTPTPPNSPSICSFIAKISLADI